MHFISAKRRLKSKSKVKEASFGLAFHMLFYENLKVKFILSHNGVMKNMLITLALLYCSQLFAQNPDVVGKWTTIDDETGKPKSVVEIFRDGDVVKGKIIELINPSEPNPTCKDCPGDKNGKPVQGMEIIWGMKEKKAGKEWGDGEILDPKKGKVYRCKLKLDGDKLEVRGFIGFSLLGRSQTWQRQQ